jgi:5-methylcytosine-specific restriction endonuclease McrA
MPCKVQWTDPPNNWPTPNPGGRATTSIHYPQIHNIASPSSINSSPWGTVWTAKPVQTGGRVTRAIRRAHPTRKRDRSTAPAGESLFGFFLLFCDRCPVRCSGPTHPTNWPTPNPGGRATTSIHYPQIHNIASPSSINSSPWGTVWTAKPVQTGGRVTRAIRRAHPTRKRDRSTAPAGERSLFRTFIFCSAGGARIKCSNQIPYSHSSKPLRHHSPC